MLLANNPVEMRLEARSWNGYRLEVHAVYPTSKTPPTCLRVGAVKEGL